MGKGLDLQLLGGLGANFRDLLQGKLPGQDDPVGPQVVPGPGGLVVDDAGLGADVDLHRGGIAFGQGQHPHVGQDDGGDAALLQKGQPLGQAGHLVVAGHGVARNVQVHPLRPAKLGSFGQLFPGEVPRKGAHAKGVPRQIDRIRPIGQSHLQPLPVPCRGQ